MSNLIVDRVKNDGIESAEIIYNEAIKSISIITSEQIKILSIIDIISSLIFLIINKKILFTEFVLLESFLNENYNITTTDIEQLKYCRLISSTFPNEIDRSAIETCTNKRLVNIITRCKEIIETTSRFGLNQIQLTPVGNAISQSNLSITIKTNLYNLSKSPLKLADFRANKIIAEGGGFNGSGS